MQHRVKKNSSVTISRIKITSTKAKKQRSDKQQFLDGPQRDRTSGLHVTPSKKQRSSNQHLLGGPHRHRTVGYRYCEPGSDTFVEGPDGPARRRVVVQLGGHRGAKVGDDPVELECEAVGRVQATSLQEVGREHLSRPRDAQCLHEVCAGRAERCRAQRPSTRPVYVGVRDEQCGVDTRGVHHPLNGLPQCGAELSVREVCAHNDEFEVLRAVLEQLHDIGPVVRHHASSLAGPSDRGPPPARGVEEQHGHVSSAGRGDVLPSFGQGHTIGFQLHHVCKVRAIRQTSGERLHDPGLALRGLLEAFPMRVPL
mmetsp:Transcript_155199/g.497722  ORF Transcript_155199/g.497722 Transcript_155199/m.497722 type:complete len:311 (+) Transcript_155199:286-1218(+)